jgi:hypothetical protein
VRANSLSPSAQSVSCRRPSSHAVLNIYSSSWLQKTDAGAKASEATGQAAQLTAAAMTSGLNMGFGAINSFLSTGGSQQPGVSSVGAGGMGDGGATVSTPGIAPVVTGRPTASNIFGASGREPVKQEEVQATDTGLFTSAQDALAGARAKEAEAKVSSVQPIFVLVS